jgi:hypothetical protein
MIPNLLNAVDVDIEQLDTSATVYDSDFREPVQQANHSVKKTVKGQVKWSEGRMYGSEMATTPIGVEDNAAGYVLFRFVDLEAKSIVLKNNDRFVKLGKIDTDLYVIALQPCGHWSDQKGATMIKAYFLDRAPSRPNAK